MIAKKLKLNCFRNYENLEFNAGNGLNVIYGENGQGKTNIVEAIFFCAAGRSPRTPRDAELIMHGRRGFKVELEYNRKNEISGTMLSQLLSIEYEREKKKKVFVNEVPVKRISDIVGNFNAVFFSPEEMSIVRGGPSNRRHFIDIALCQSSRSYLLSLQRFLKALEQKNRLLKKLSDEYGSPDAKNTGEVEIWNEIIAEEGSDIVLKRKNYTSKLNEKTSETVYKISGMKEETEIKYLPSAVIFDLYESESREDIKKDILNTVSKNIKKEIMQGVSLYGPHRDEWSIKMNNRELKIYGSQGQQRTVTAAIKIAEALIMEEYTGHRPVIILDDIMSELDGFRKLQMAELISKRQVFVTCTERDLFNKVKDSNAVYHEVIKGNVVIH